jgi:hypothetical protein
MLQEILKPLLENDVLTDEVKKSLEDSLTEAFKIRENAVREEVETAAKATFEAASTKFETAFKTLETDYKAKLNEAKAVAEGAKETITEMEATILELESKPFVNISESDLEKAEAKLLSEAEAKYEKAFDLGKEKFNRTFEMFQESHAAKFEEMTDVLVEAQEYIVALEAKMEALLDLDIDKLISKTSLVQDKVNEAVKATKDRMIAEADERVEKLKANLVTSTEIFLEQELAEVKADKAAIMKETQGRELLESIKGIVKQYWDVDSEIAQELLEMKKDAEAKVEQYKGMLKKEHARLEESQTLVENLKKQVIVESKGAVLAKDKKEALQKLAENIESDKLESQIDSLMESVVDIFNSGFSKKDVTEATKKTETILTESAKASKTSISSGDVNKEDKMSDELATMLSYAGIRN